MYEGFKDLGGLRATTFRFLNYLALCTLSNMTQMLLLRSFLVIWAFSAIQTSALTTNEETALRDFVSAFPGLQYLPTRWNINNITLACSNQTWTGLTCSAENGNVVSINLNFYQLGVNPQGYLPVSISNFTYLRQLTLIAQLSYTIPATLGALSNLEYLSLYGSGIQGPIPISLGNLLSLSYMDLSSNKLIGALPESFSQLQQLKHLALSGNQLDVKSSILSKLSNLRHLDLGFIKSLDSIPCIPTYACICTPLTHRIFIK